MMLRWQTEKETDEAGHPIASTTTIEFGGDVAEWVALCEAMPGLAESSMARSIENVCLAAQGDKP